VSKPSGAPYAAVLASAPWHKKIRDIPEQKRLAAFGFWVSTLCLCQTYRNDGQVPLEQLTAVFPCTEQQRDHLIELLVTHGLFDKTGDGIAVHDYLEHNRSAAQIASGVEGMRRGGVRSGERRRKQRSEGTFRSSTEREEIAVSEEPSSGESAVRCGWCSGTGKTDDRECPSCSGTGTVSR